MTDTDDFEVDLDRIEALAAAAGLSIEQYLQVGGSCPRPPQAAAAD